MIISLPDNFSGKNALHLEKNLYFRNLSQESGILFLSEREFFVAGNEEEFC